MDARIHFELDEYDNLYSPDWTSDRSVRDLTNIK